jgi:uncharacterized protein (DUF488 family)
MNPIFSIGHSNHPEERLLDLLEQHRIDVLVDVRSSPFSRYVPHFNAPALKVAVDGRGIRYLALGKELGGRPDGDEFYDAESHVLYGRLARAPLFQEGIARLDTGQRKYRIALLCSEEDPAVCHRHLLIGRVLAERGTILQHIRGTGLVQTYDEIEAERRAKPAGVQLSLFGDAGPAEEEWRSLRSVSRKDPPESSSAL